MICDGMLPLDDLTVLDLSRILSGPYCSMYLADFGARVIKLEHPDGGDDTRGFGPPFVGGESTYFMSINRNKESVAIDFKHARGSELLRALAARADILLENFRPGALAPSRPRLRNACARSTRAPSTAASPASATRATPIGCAAPATISPSRAWAAWRR